jgi:hypothetical protein
MDGAQVGAAVGHVTCPRSAILVHSLLVESHICVVLSFCHL